MVNCSSFFLKTTLQTLQEPYETKPKTLRSGMVGTEDTPAVGQRPAYLVFSRRKLLLVRVSVCSLVLRWSLCNLLTSTQAVVGEVSCAAGDEGS